MSEEQLPLVGVEPAPFNPRWPNGGTLENEALQRLLKGERLTQQAFVNHSWRLAAIINKLSAMGWPLRRGQVPMAEEMYGRSRLMASYSLPPSVIALAKEMSSS